MSTGNNLKDFLKDVADAIRAKKNTASAINPQNFSREIADISTASSPEIVIQTVVLSTKGNDIY